MNKRTLIVGIVLAGILAGGILFFRKSNMSGLNVPGQSGLKTKGPADAPVEIVEYSDFQCPACMKAQPTLKAIMEEYPGKIRVTFMHFPLPMHQWAGLAHQAAECANQQGKFWEYHDLVYSKQTVWSSSPNPSESLIAYGRDAGLDLDKFGVCLSDGAITKKILEERARGQSLQLASTPTFFINGERVVGPIELENRGRDVVRKTLGLPPLPPKPPAAFSLPEPPPPPGALPSQSSKS